jgi:hypothetical protein
MFNHVVHTGFPQSWLHHTIHPIHKSGSSVDPNNYGTILVGHTLSKIYAMILHINLSRELYKRYLKARGQARFQPAHHTIDHILTLWAIIKEA